MSNVRLDIIIMGPYGAGKTTLTERIARTLEWPRLSLDELQRAYLKELDNFEQVEQIIEFIKIYGILPAPRRKERTAMLRYTSERDKANQILNLTSLTVEQFEQLVDPFEHAFVRHMNEWTMEGKPRTARAYTPYANSPLPTAEDRLLFLLSYLKVASLQVAHGAAFGMTQPNANK